MMHTVAYRFSDLIDAWDSVVGLELARMTAVRSFDIHGSLYITARAERTQFPAIAAEVKAKVPPIVDSIGIKRVIVAPYHGPEDSPL